MGNSWAQPDENEANNFRLAVIDAPLSAPPEFLPHGTDQSAFLLCRALEKCEEFHEIDYFSDLSQRDAESLGRKSISRLFLEAGKYRAAYAPSGLLRLSPFAARPWYDVLPIVSEFGTSHHPNVWRNLFHSAVSGSLRPTDGFIFKSKRTESIFCDIWKNWSQRFDRWPAFPVSKIIPNAVDISCNKHDSSMRASCRRELGVKDDSVIFLAFSRLAPVSKLDYLSLIILWREIVIRHPNAVLIISGALISAPDYRQFPQDLSTVARELGVAQNIIVLPNPFERWTQARTALMSAADVFVHTTRGVEETCPNVILEAMSFGLPVIGTDWSGLDSLIVDGITGRLIDTWATPVDEATRQSLFGRPHNATAQALEASVGIDGSQLITAVAECMSSATRTRMSAAARKRVRSEFTLEIIGLRRSQFIKDIASISRGPPERDVCFVPLVDLERITVGLSKTIVHEHTKIIYVPQLGSRSGSAQLGLDSQFGRAFFDAIASSNELTVASLCESLRSTLGSMFLDFEIFRLLAVAVNTGVVRLA